MNVIQIGKVQSIDMWRHWKFVIPFSSDVWREMTHEVMMFRVGY